MRNLFTTRRLPLSGALAVIAAFLVGCGPTTEPNPEKVEPAKCPCVDCPCKQCTCTPATCNCGKQRACTDDDIRRECEELDAKHAARRGIVYKSNEPDPVTPQGGHPRVNTGPYSPDKAEYVQIDYPLDRTQHNVGGSDGAGLCVFTSMMHAGDWQNDPLWYVMRDFMRQYPGGGYPEKVEAMLARAAQKHGYPKPDYIHVLEDDLEILKLATKNRLMPCVTYGKSLSGRYGGRYINHMVNLVHATDNWFAVLDNNYEKSFEWHKPAEYLRAGKSVATNNFGGGHSNGTLWAMILLTVPPPPAPHN